MLQLSKEAQEYIDTICEWPPYEPSNEPFNTEEERIKEDDHIAEIADFIARAVVDNTDLEYITELLQKITSINFKMIRELITEVAQRRRQQLNLEQRIFALEQQRQNKGVSSFD